ncbi:MAG: helix-hairpin-helix domain-containing protein [Cyclobacteriaceae bacterium]|nr:helix-hairpin-helix domain-containing protein [Cyclobacteriaceae bacterium]
MKSIFCSLAVGFIMVYLLNQPLHGQSWMADAPDNDIEQLLNNLFPGPVDEEGLEDLYESLLLLYQQPIDINTAKYEELRQLFMLSERQISNLLRYRRSYGRLYSIYELEYIEGFDRPFIEALSEFIRFDRNREKPRGILPKIDKSTQHQWLMRYGRILERRRGFTAPDTLAGGRSSNRYAGDPGHYFMRYRMQKRGDYSLGFTLEKDPGEPFRWNPAQHWYGPDFISGHYRLENRGILKNLIIGDFNFQSGHGLIFGPLFRMGKGDEPVRTLRPAPSGFKPYTSVHENVPFRGLSASLEKGIWSLHTFYSSLRRSSSPIVEESDGESLLTGNLRSSGLHRSPGELAGRKNLREQSAGFSLSAIPFLHGNLVLGLQGVGTRFDKEITPIRRRYNQFAFQGREQFNYGFFINYRAGDMLYFSEWSANAQGGRAILAGMLGNLGRSLEASMLYRNYSPLYNSFYGNAFGESAINSNEEGIFMGIKYMPLRGLSIKAWSDYFRFPWLRYRIDAPSYGHDASLVLHYDWRENFRLRLQYRTRERWRNIPLDFDSPLYSPLPANTRSARSDISLAATESLWLHTRFRWSRFLQYTTYSSGFLIAQDVEYAKKQWMIAARMAVFDTDDFDSRQFVYERDVLYFFAVPAFHRRGVRYYITTRLHANSTYSFWLKWARTRFTDQDFIGSGLDRIEGNTRTDIRIMCRIKL